MTIKQTIGTPINGDSNAIKAVVNEATDGIKAVPTELVLKASDNSTFTQVTDANPLPMKLTGSYVRLSTETKPTVGVKDGNDLLEVDTGKVFVFYSGIWRQI